MMETTFDPWLRALRSARKGGFALKPLDRGHDYSCTLNFFADFSSDSFSAALRASPVDDPSATTPLAQFTVVVGAFDGTKTPVTLTLATGDQADLPADGDADGIAIVFWDMIHTPLAGDPYRLCAGAVEILGGVTSGA